MSKEYRNQGTVCQHAAGTKAVRHDSILKASFQSAVIPHSFLVNRHNDAPVPQFLNSLDQRNINEKFVDN